MNWVATGRRIGKIAGSNGGILAWAACWPLGDRLGGSFQALVRTRLRPLLVMRIDQLGGPLDALLAAGLGLLLGGALAWPLEDPLEGSLEELLVTKVGPPLGDTLMVVRCFGHWAVHWKDHWETHWEDHWRQQWNPSLGCCW